MHFNVQSKQITIVYANDYVSAANIIETRIQSFTGHTSRSWDVSFYEANKAILDSNQRVLFLGGFVENPAAKTYEKVFVTTEKIGGCAYSFAGSKALIYPIGKVSEDSNPPDESAHFYSDSTGNTQSGNSSASLEKLMPSFLYTAGGQLIDWLLTSETSIRQKQLEAGCEAFMEKQFAQWVGYTTDRS